MKKTAKINSIFLAIVLIAGTFAAVYPSFIIGIQAQADYEYENGYGYDNYNNDSYNSAEYPSPSYEYPQQAYDEYESNQENDYYNYPPTENPVSVDIVVPIDFETIQEAINAANEGDVIKVLPSTYIEQITINKTLTIIDSDAESTIIEAPPLEELKPNVIGLPYIVEVNNGAEVTIKGFAINGIEDTNCDGLLGISVFGDATLKLDSAVIKDCTFRSVFVGTLFVPGQSGHATITNTVITDYQNTGVFVVGPNSTLKMSYNKVVGSAPEVVGIIGIQFAANATGTITNNEVSENICEIPNTCGPDWFNQIQAFGIVADSAGEGSVIANNYVTNNDAGISVAVKSGCCIVDQNTLKDNRFFGIVIEDSEQIVSNTKIFGGKVGTAAAATFGNTTATLDHVKIIGAETPIQALSSGNLTAAVNVLSPSFFQP